VSASGDTPQRDADGAVRYESRDGIAIITINRPERLNALNEAVIQGLANAWRRFEHSDDRVAVLHAAGDRAFSVGADIKDPPQEMWQGVPGVGVAVAKPIIAAVRGWCIGGAYVIVQMCDLVVAADDTVFKYPEAQLGFTGGLIASAVARIPHKIAMEFMLLGQDMRAERALQAGMINRIVPAGTELDAALEYAAILRHSAPLVVSTLKAFSLETLNRSPAEAGALARERLLEIRNSDDGAEGRRAFAAKRTPEFTGR
jgi:enoyl-CoA hydratase